jgi:hypothetical protein
MYDRMRTRSVRSSVTMWALKWLPFAIGRESELLRLDTGLDQMKRIERERRNSRHESPDGSIECSEVFEVQEVSNAMIDAALA